MIKVLHISSSFKKWVVLNSSPNFNEVRLGISWEETIEFLVQNCVFKGKKTGSSSKLSGKVRGKLAM